MVESLLEMIIEVLEINHKDELPHLQYVAECINRMMGFMVVVPSNPEDQFFILVEGMMSLIAGDNEWTEDKGSRL
jgi:pyruvate/2-oxoglutarate/acetoin dehydrogenase E1 component